LKRPITITGNIRLSGISCHVGSEIMIQLVIVKNPFKPLEHEIKEIVYMPKTTLQEYYPGEYDFALNGKIIEKPNKTYLNDGSQIIVIPHIAGGSFKEIFTFAAMVALAVYAPIMVEHWGLHGIAAALATGAVMYVGGRIVNAIVQHQTTCQRHRLMDGKHRG